MILIKKRVSISLLFLFSFYSCNTVKEIDESKISLYNDMLIQAVKDNEDYRIVPLLENGADINAINKKGWSPLLLAIDSNSQEVVNVLIEEGADLYHYSYDNDTPLYLAIKNKQVQIALLLLERGTDYTTKKDGKSLLMYSIEYKTPEIANELIKYHDIDINIKGKEGLTPLMLALRNDQPEIAVSLIKSGAKINIQSDGGWSPLMYALFKDYSEVAQLLLNEGADIDIVDSLGKVGPIALASTGRHIKLLEYMLVKKKVLTTWEKIYVAWFYATIDSELAIRQWSLELILSECEDNDYSDVNLIDTLAAVYASLEKWDLAVEYQQKAYDMAPNDEHFKGFLERLELYKNKDRYYVPINND